MCNKKGELEEQELEKEDSAIEHRLKLTTDEIKKNLIVFDKIKAHQLLNICVFFLGLMFFFELFTGEVETRKNIVEIFKSLILILSGYLFAKYNEK